MLSYVQSIQYVQLQVIRSVTTSTFSKVSMFSYVQYMQYLRLRPVHSICSVTARTFSIFSYIQSIQYVHLQPDHSVCSVTARAFSMFSYGKVITVHSVKAKSQRVNLASNKLLFARGWLENSSSWLVVTRRGSAKSWGTEGVHSATVWSNNFFPQAVREPFEHGQC